MRDIYRMDPDGDPDFDGEEEIDPYYSEEARLERIWEASTYEW